MRISGDILNHHHYRSSLLQCISFNHYTFVPKQDYSFFFLPNHSLFACAYIIWHSFTKFWKFFLYKNNDLIKPFELN